MKEIIFVAFIIKHFVCDFPLQKPRHYLNKGTYGHWGGIEHALIHALGTWVVVASFGFNPIFAMLIDFVVHYHVDWFKMWWNAKKNYSPQDSMFWIWLGIDQMAHYLTYVALIALFIK